MISRSITGPAWAWPVRVGVRSDFTQFAPTPNTTVMRSVWMVCVLTAFGLKLAVKAKSKP
jgi:cytosine/uracil/thiamine/allantoin permease